MFSFLKEEFIVWWFLLHAGFTSSHQHYASQSDRSYDVIVIGAGASGMAALTRLHQAGLEVLGLEAENRIGGRIMTKRYGTGVVELGAEWIHGYNIVYKLAKEAKAPFAETDFSKFHYLSINGSQLPCYEECQKVISHMYASLEMTRREPLVNFEEYINGVYEAYISSLPDLITPRPLLDIIQRWYKLPGYTIDGAGDWTLLSTKGWTDFHTVDGPNHLYCNTEKGYSSLFDILLNGTDYQLDDSPLDIKLNKEVVHVDWAPKTANDLVSVECADGSVYEASKVIVTVSLGVLQANHETMFTPPLPAAKVQSINNLDIGQVMKMALRYEYNWWGDRMTNLGFIWDENTGDILSEGDRWLEEIYGATMPAGSDNVLTLWLTGRAVWFVETLPLQTLKMKLDWLVRKCCEPHFSDYHDSAELQRSTWVTNPHFLGTYTYHGLRSDIIDDPTEALREPIASSGTLRLLFGGEATSKHFYSTVHGAVESGWREADRILADRL